IKVGQVSLWYFSAGCRYTAHSGSEPLGQIFETERITIFDRRMGRIKQFKKDIGDANLHQRATESFGSQIQEILVALPGVYIDRFQSTQGLRVTRHHAYRVPGEPAFPHGGDQGPCRRVVGEMDGPIVVSGVAGGHTPAIQGMVVRILTNRGTA